MPQKSSNMKNKCCHQILLFLLIGVTSLSACAEITVKLQAPRWEFLLQNQPWGAAEAQLAAGESSFARSIQPLLAAQDHTAILNAFEKRNIDNDSAALRLLRGQVLLSLKRYQEAETALQATLASMPDLALAHRSISMVYMLTKQYSKARQHLSRSIELGVADAQVYGQLAFVNLQLGQAASAVAGYQQALFMEMDNDQWRQGLLFALIQSHAFDQAQVMLEEMLQNDAKNPQLWLQRGQLALKQERPQQAIASLETALQLGINDADNIATTAQLHIQSGSPRRAVDLLNGHLRTLVNNGKTAMLDQIAAWLAHQEDWRELRSLLRSLDRDKTALPVPFASRFAVYRAQVAIADGKQKQARQHLQRAIADDPANGEALLLLAKLLRDERRNEQAVLYYTRAEALPLFKERAWLGRAQLEIDRQNYKEALRVLTLVAQANPNRGDVRANIESLQSLLRSQG